jgi:heme-binding protein
LKKWLRLAGVAAAVTLIVLQFIPIDRTNPPARSQPPASPEVQAILRRACYDCHSNETNWPWFSHVAPASLLMSRDVKEGRREVNFSTWENYDARRRTRKLNEIAKEVREGDMPPWYYTPIHPEAKLSAGDRDKIINWTAQAN